MTAHSTLPQGLYRSRPRAVRLSVAGRLLGVTAVVLCLAAPAMAVFLQVQARVDRIERETLVRSGLITDATVVRLKRESKESKSATVYYRFAVKGRTFESRAKVPIARWRALSVGSALPVRFIADNPNVNRPDGIAPGVMPAALPYVLSTIPVTIGVFCWFGLRYQRRLLSDGRAALATITTVKKHRTQNGSYIQVGYEFALLNGAMKAGSANTTDKAVEVGSSIAVLYDADDPSDSRPYPLSLVRLAEPD